MKKFTKITLWIVVVAVYLNIGWAITSFIDHNVAYVDDPQGVVAEFFAGPENNFVEDSSANVIENDTGIYVIMSIMWPIFLFIVAICWFFWGVYSGVSWLVMKLLWLIFAGGIAKLLGLA